MAHSMAESTRAKWLGWLQEIKGDLRGLMCAKYTFRTVQDIIKFNPVLHQPSSFYDYLAQTYASHAIIGIRRQLKAKDSVSLRRLLEEMTHFPQFLTRDYYCGLYAGSPIEDLAGEDFEHFAQPGADHIDPAMVQADLDALVVATKGCEHYADRRVAHWDRRGAAEIPTYADLDNCLDLLDRLYVKYHLLFHAQHMDTLLPTWQYDWQTIFRTPWLPSDQAIRQS